MALIAKSPVGLEVSEPKSNYLPEVILTVGIDESLESLRLGDRIKYLKNFAQNFNHYEFYANLSNDLAKDRKPTMAKLRAANLLNEDEFLSLYLKIDKDSELATKYKEELDDIELDQKKEKKVKKDQRPQLRPGGSDEDENKLKKKQDYVFTPPKLRL